jgi:hypothetical protein
MFEAPKQEHTKYTTAELTKMVPCYMVSMDAQDEEAGVEYLKEKFHERPVDILVFAGMIATLLDDRKKDPTYGEQEHVVKGTDAGQDDTVEPAVPAGGNSGADVVVD